MASKARSVRHLHNRAGRYFARIAVPVALRPIVGKRELLEPLGADRTLAIVKINGAVAGFHRTLADAQRGIKPPAPPVSIRRAVHDHYAAELAIDELCEQPARPDTRHFNETAAPILLQNLRRIASGDIGENDWTDRDAVERNQMIRAHLERVRADPEDIDDGNDRFPRRDSIGTSEAELTSRDTFIEATVGFAIDKVCNAQGVSRPKAGTKEYLDLARALASAQIEAMQRVRERDAGEYGGKPSFRLLREPATEAAQEPPVSIMGLLDTYVAMLGRSGRGEQAGKRWQPCFRRLTAYLGHDDARRVTKADLRGWLDHLRETGLSEATLRDNDLASVRAAFRYAAEQDVIPSNPTLDVRIRLGRRVQTREKGFSDAEAAKIIAASRSYQPKPSANPATRESDTLVAAKRWAPMLCALTGARIAEMTQLRKSDVRELDGITYLHLTPDAGSIKTGQFRDVPLHPQLIELGFLDFVSAAPDGPLFYVEKAGRKGTSHPSKTVSGRISQWLQTLAIIPDGVDPNHAWRHRFKTVGREAGIDSRILDAIQGHAARTAGESYGDVTLKAKTKAINQLPGIEIAK